ncbi:hypothetical protein MCAV_02260 [[Mycoplasma] cavipharyngis]
MITVFPSEASGWIGNVFAWIIVLVNFIIVLFLLIISPFIIKWIYKKYWDIRTFNYLKRVMRENIDIVRNRRKIFKDDEGYTYGARGKRSGTSKYEKWFYETVKKHPEYHQWKDKIFESKEGESSRYSDFSYKYL